MPALTMNELRAFIGLFESMYPDYYGYTDFTENMAEYPEGTQRYYLFRNRDESFEKQNAIVVMTYRE